MAALSLIFCDFPPSDRPEASKTRGSFSATWPPLSFHTAKTHCGHSYPPANCYVRPWNPSKRTLQTGAHRSWKHPHRGPALAQPNRLQVEGSVSVLATTRSSVCASDRSANPVVCATPARPFPRRSHLLRSGFETLSTLIHLNQLVQQVWTETRLPPVRWEDHILLLGSRDGSTGHKSLNIGTILVSAKAVSRPRKAVWHLSESAHPNYEGMLVGYSKVDRDEMKRAFRTAGRNFMGRRTSSSIGLCMKTFHHEYDDVGLT